MSFSTYLETFIVIANEERWQNGFISLLSMLDFTEIELLES
jgi:hypothetical protein